MPRKRGPGFGDFYAEHVAQVRSYVARRLSNPSEIEEVTHDTFANVLEAGKDGRDLANRGYLITTARNLVINMYRRNSVRRETDDAEAVLQERPADEADQASEIIGRERLELLKEAFARLTPLQQEVILLRKLDGMKLKEIADLKGVSVSLIEKQIRYGLRECQNFLDEMEDESQIDSAISDQERA